MRTGGDLCYCDLEEIIVIISKLVTELLQGSHAQGKSHGKRFSFQGQGKVREF